MKKTTLIILCFLFVKTISAQTDCFSGRFDQEVFTSINTTSDILFGSNIDVNGASTDLMMDIYEPAGDTMANRPLIIWAHGGSFIGGSKLDNDVVSLSEHFAKRGYVCASITYRLGVYPITADNAKRAVYRATQDFKAAVRFFRKDAATTNQYKINSNIIFAGGSSAGAFAALHLAYLDNESELPSAIDTALLGGIEGNSGNPSYASNVNAIIDLCGALGDKTWMTPTDIPFVAMHGDVDGTVPYATSMIYLLGIYPIMIVDGSYSVATYANTIGIENDFYTYFGADHVPYASNTNYMDTTVRFVSNFLYRQLGCTPSDPSPLPNTFTTGINSLSANQDVLIYPNPATDKVRIHLVEKENNFYLYDISGSIILEKKNILSDTDLDLKNYNAGIYFYQISTSRNSYSGKLVIGY